MTIYVIIIWIQDFHGGFYMNTTKTISTIVLVLQFLAVLLAFGIVAMQKSIVPVFFSRMEYDGMVYPTALFTMTISLVFYAVFFIMINNEASDNKKNLAMIFLILYIIMSLLEFVASYFSSFFYSRISADALAMHSVVNSLLILPAFIATPTAPLFFFACGRYSVEASSAPLSNTKTIQ